MGPHHYVGHLPKSFAQGGFHRDSVRRITQMTSIDARSPRLALGAREEGLDVFERPVESGG